MPGRRLPRRRTSSLRMDGTTSPASVFPGFLQFYHPYPRLWCPNTIYLSFHALFTLTPLFFSNILGHGASEPGNANGRLRYLRGRYRSQRPQPESSKLHKSSKPPGISSSGIPRRWPGRQFHGCVSRFTVSLEACRIISSSFEFEKSDREKSESVVLDLEKWVGYEVAMG